MSYIGIIAKCILESPGKRILLSELYEWILTQYPYFRYRGQGWRNSVRHNLSLNECFVKAGRAANGKSSYWTIHPANIEDFSRGDFRRKQAQWKVKSHDVQIFANQFAPFPMLPFWHSIQSHHPFQSPSKITVAKKPSNFDVASLLKND
uniref:Fork-head domain-containing protein n=1 Tax=Panagrolaimus superbus TaxID=310955 RepID=A0A914Z013_9BILA